MCYLHLENSIFDIFELRRESIDCGLLWAPVWFCFVSFCISHPPLFSPVLPLLPPHHARHAPAAPTLGTLQLAARSLPAQGQPTIGKHTENLRKHALKRNHTSLCTIETILLNVSHSVLTCLYFFSLHKKTCTFKVRFCVKKCFCYSLVYVKSTLFNITKATNLVNRNIVRFLVGMITPYDLHTS